MGKIKDPPKKMDPLKRTDPPKGVVGEAHLVLPSVGLSSADPPEGGGRANLVLPAIGSAGGDLPIGVHARGHRGLAALQGGGGESVADESNWAMHELPAVQSGSVGGGTNPDHLRAAQITVGTAQRIVGSAHEVLRGLAIPNDLSEAHHQLFLELRRTVADLQQSLAGLEEENRRLSDENKELRKKLDDGLPLLKRAWETFVLKGAEAAGGGAVFTAGFVAGMTYSAFAAEAPGIGI